MPQRFYIDDSDLKGQLIKLDDNLSGMLDFAYLHEDMYNTIEALMDAWGKENIATYPSIVQEFSNLPEDQKKWYDSIDDWLSEEGRWWLTEFDHLNDADKKLFIQRYRLTISYCLHSSTYNYEALQESIDKAWESIATS